MPEKELSYEELKRASPKHPESFWRRNAADLVNDMTTAEPPAFLNMKTFTLGKLIVTSTIQGSGAPLVGVAMSDHDEDTFGEELLFLCALPVAWAALELVEAAAELRRTFLP